VTRAAFPVLVALALRLALALACDRVVADVARYERVGEHLLDVSPNPYATRRLYPYPPPWAAVEAGALALARSGSGSFALLVKLPAITADGAIVALLAGAAARGGAPALAPWLYALHPVSLLVTAAHGQFDAIPLAFVLLAVLLAERGRDTGSALALGAGVAFKSFPVLALPFLALRRGRSPRDAARYAVLALAPVAALLLPFALADPGALRRELFAYGGIADFGWAGAARGVAWLATGELARSEASHWPRAALVSKLVFLAAWALLVLLLARLRLGRRHADASTGASELLFEPRRAVLLALVLFGAVYGLQSAQYLLWVVPLSMLGPTRIAGLHGFAAATGLVGFYLFLAPGVLWPGGAAAPPFAAGVAWTAGAALTWLASVAWLWRLVDEAKTKSLPLDPERV
jgi:hypothetical protein